MSYDLYFQPRTGEASRDRFHIGKRSDLLDVNTDFASYRKAGKGAHSGMRQVELQRLRGKNRGLSLRTLTKANLFRTLFEIA